MDLVIRNGTVVDGSGASARVADVGIVGDRVVAVEPALSGRAHREIEADGRVVTPGFVDIHTHLDAQLAWDPIGTSSCWHGVTSVVMGNCGVTFAPCRPEDRSYLAELMESVEDIPRDAILGGLPWDWVTYGEYLGSMGRLPKGPNVGGMVGHCAVRQHAMGRAQPGRRARHRGRHHRHGEAGRRGHGRRRARVLDLADAAPHRPRRPTGPGHVGQHRRALRLRRRAGPARARASSRPPPASASATARTWPAPGPRWRGWARCPAGSGRPVTFGLVQSDRRPELFRQIVGFAKEQNALGGCVRPQTTARGVGVLFGLQSRTPFDRSPAWQALHGLSLQEQLLVLRDAARRSQLIAEAEDHPARFDLDMLFVLPPGPARYDCPPETSLAAHAEQRGVSAAAAFIELALETDGALGVQLPVPQPAPRRGRGDAGRSPGDPGPGRRRRPRRPDHGRQPAHVLPHLLDPGAGAVGVGGGGAAAHLRHGRSCSASPTAASCAPGRSPTSTSSTSRR